MPHNKKHHFVPRFYLKKFAQNEGKSISIHNLTNSKTILKGNLYNQCYRDYLYGKDDAYEKALGVIESAGGKIISSIINSKQLPLKMTEGYFSLLVYVLFQKSRTIAAGEQMNSLLDNLHSSVFTDLAMSEADRLGITRKELEEVTIRYEHPERAALAHTAQIVPTTFDLNMKVLERDGPLEFITSDNPVVFYNPFALGSRRRIGSATGFQSKGLQIYMPLSQNLTAIYYDSDVYKIGDRKKTIVSIDEKGVISLNSLQLINATENVYFSSDLMATIVEREANRVKSKRTSKMTGLRITPSTPTSDLVHLYKKDIESTVKLPFCKLLKQPPIIWDPGVVGSRNPEFSTLYAEFLDELRGGRWQPSDFWRFFQSRDGL